MEPTEFRTERLVLRPWRLDDVDDAFAYASDPEWARYLWRVPQPYTYRDAEEFVARTVLEGWREQAVFAVEYEGHVIGGVRLGITDHSGRVAGLGYNISRAHWGKGLGTEAVAEVVSYGFETLGLHRIFATADARNLASIRVMQKLGMQQEATLRQHRFYRGEYIDEVHYGILAEEYFAGR